LRAVLGQDAPSSPAEGMRPLTSANPGACHLTNPTRCPFAHHDGWLASGMAEEAMERHRMDVASVLANLWHLVLW
jgi:hypothetical protein